MKQEIIEFLKALGCENIQVPSDTPWVRASCPFAPWLHKKGSDRHPSFGVNAPDSEEGTPTYHCFTCQQSGILPKLLHNLQLLSKTHNKEASDILSSMVFGEKKKEARARKRIIVPADKFRRMEEMAKEQKRNDPVPDSILAKYPLLAETDSPEAKRVLDWLTDTRMIGVQLIAQYKLRFYQDPISGNVGVIYPIYDRKGEIVLDMWARLVEVKSFFRLTSKLSGSDVDYHAPNLWFGNQFFDPARPIILVEGSEDVLRLRSLGVKNVWGCGGGGPTKAQCYAVNSRVVYYGFDSDDAGAEFTKRAVKLIKAPVRFVLRWSIADAKDAGALKSKVDFKKVFDNRLKLETVIKPMKPVREKREKKPVTGLKFDPFNGI